MGYTPEDPAKKGAANGYASLNATTLVPAAQLGTGTPDATTYLNGAGAWVGLVSSNWTVVKLTANQTNTNNTTATAITGFNFAPAAAKVYAFEAYIITGNNASGQAPRIQVSWATGGLGMVTIETTATANTSWSTSGNASATVISNNGTWIGTNNVTGFAKISGTFYAPTAASGSISIGFLAPVSNPVNTSKVMAGSVFSWVSY